MNSLNRFEKAAKRITEFHGVHVEWAPANREYVVEGRPANNARKADQKARQLSREANHLFAGTRH